MGLISGRARGARGTRASEAFGFLAPRKKFSESLNSLEGAAIRSSTLMIVTGLPPPIAGLREQLTVAQQELPAARLEIARRRQKLDALARRYFGKKSEQLSGDQLELLMSGLEESAVVIPAPAPPATAPARRPREGTQRVRTPDHLEVVREVIQPKEVQAVPQQWKEIGREVSRQLDYQPGKFFWLETVRLTESMQ